MLASDLTTIPFQTNSGDTTTLEAFAGQVVLIVNTASECGHTPQYAGLEAIYEKYKSRGFTVVAFPSNDFDAQEPGTDAQIRNFCTTMYGVQFPLMKKIPVLGENKHPLYKYLVEHSEPADEIQWNFTKFLLDRNGNVAARFHYRVKPDAPEVIAKIEELLGEKPSE
ncbi:MAG: glutathione peroxidase [bacterium]|nr:glutathione peroxidase [bacterium]